MYAPTVNQIVTLLLAEVWTERIGHLVRFVTPEDEKRRIRLPASRFVNGKPCGVPGGEMILVPDKGIRSLVYFEALQPSQPSRRLSRYEQREVRLRMVVWLNLKKLGLTDQVAYEEQFAQRIRGACLPRTFTDVPNQVFQGLLMSAVMEPWGQQVFRGCLFAEDVQPLLGDGYCPFAMEISYRVLVPLNCAPDITLGASTVC